MVRKDCHSGSDGPRYLPLITETLKEARALKTADAVSIKQFSDSIIISQKFSQTPEDFSAFCNLVGQVQARFLFRGIMCRGGVAFGKHSEEDDIIFSQALVVAYGIESKISQNPRILVSNELAELFNLNTTGFCRDKDGMYFVDFSSHFEATNIRAVVDHVLTESPLYNHVAASKSRWLVDYLGKVFPDEVGGLAAEIEFFA